MIDVRTAPYALLIMRLALGAMYLSHGLMKAILFGFGGTAGFFQSLGLPGPLGYLTIVAEVVGGLMLILGIYARAVAILLLPTLIGAWVFVHGDKGWLFSNPGGGWEFIAFLIATSIAIALGGDGALAVKPTTRR